MQWIDEFDEGWLTWLTTQHNAMAQKTRVQLLLDGVFLPGVLNRLNHTRYAGQKAEALFGRLRGCSDEALAVAPVVVEFDPDDVALLRVLRECNAKPMVTAIATTDTSAQLADRLARWCVVEVTGSAFNFRFPDTRRLPAIARVLRPGQRVDMLGPTCEWHCVNRRGQWEALPFGPADVDLAETAKLDDAQFANLLRDSEADEMVASLMPDLTAEWLARPPSARHDNACKVLNEADAQMIDSPGMRMNLVAAAFKTEYQKVQV